MAISKLKFGVIAVALSMIGVNVIPVSPARAQASLCGPSVRVGFGDTLASIARRCGTSVSALMAANPQLVDANRIFLGMTVYLPGGGPGPRPPTQGAITRYTVQRGDTVASIARAFNLTLAEIFVLNPDLDGRTMRPGDIVRLPGTVVAPPPPPPPPPDDPVVRYTVRPGDTIGSIAAAAGVTRAAIYRVNPGIDVGDLRAGDIILLPVGAAPPPSPEEVNTFRYSVRPGDTIFSIARAHGMTTAQIYALNPGLDARYLRVGQLLRLRGGIVPPTPPPAPPIDEAVVLSPAGGGPGTIVQVSASGFPAFAPVRLLAGLSVRGLREFQQVSADARGRVTASVRVPGWAANEPVLYFAYATLDGRRRALSGPFTIVQEPPPPPSDVSVRGTLTGEGAECQAMRGDDGQLYTLVGDLRGLRAGDRVRVSGRIAEVSTCMQGVTIEVRRIRRRG